VNGLYSGGAASDERAVNLSTHVFIVLYERATNVNRELTWARFRGCFCSPASWSPSPRNGTLRTTWNESILWSGRIKVRRLSFIPLSPEISPVARQRGKDLPVHFYSVAIREVRSITDLRQLMRKILLFSIAALMKETPTCFTFVLSRD